MYVIELGFLKVYFFFYLVNLLQQIKVIQSFLFLVRPSEKKVGYLSPNNIFGRAPLPGSISLSSAKMCAISYPVPTDQGKHDLLGQISCWARPRWRCWNCLQLFCFLSQVPISFDCWHFTLQENVDQFVWCWANKGALCKVESGHLRLNV